MDDEFVRMADEEPFREQNEMKEKAARNVPVKEGCSEGRPSDRMPSAVREERSGEEDPPIIVEGPRRSNEEEQEWRIMLVGKTGGGRSASGNTILGGKRLKSELSPKPVTQAWVKEERAENWKGKKITIIDTPNIFDASLKEPQKSQEIQKYQDLAKPGPHALVFVTQVGRFTEEDVMALKNVEELFGQETTKYMIVLFTRKEDLDPMVGPEDYVETSGNPALQDLVKRCQGRCCAFNNKLTGQEGAQQAEKLLSVIEKMVRQNQDSPYLMEPPEKMEVQTADGASSEENKSEGSARKRDKKEPPEPEMKEKAARNVPVKEGCSEGSPSDRVPSDAREARSGEEERPMPMEDTELRIALIGKTGVGKSATGNTILGEKRFKSTTSPTSETKTCEKKETVIDGRKIVVVDTPGFFDTSDTLEETSKEIEKCVKCCFPGPHVIIQVMHVARFTQEEKRVAQLIHKNFNFNAKNYMIILFTHKDDLYGKPLEAFLEEGDASLREQIDRCGGRCLAFNNKAEGQEREEQVKELLGMIDAMLEKNNKAPYYTEEMLARDQREIGKEWKGQQGKDREPKKEKGTSKYKETCEKIFRFSYPCNIL